MFASRGTIGCIAFFAVLLVLSGPSPGFALATAVPWDPLSTWDAGPQASAQVSADASVTEDGSVSSPSPETTRASVAERARLSLASRPPTARGRGHTQIWDYLAGAAAAGATWAVAESYCQQSGFDASALWAAPLAVAVISIPVSDGPNPYRDRHPPEPYENGKERWYPQDVEVMTRDGEWIAGYLSMKGGTARIKTRHGRRQIPLDSIAVIDIPDDRSRWWDQAVVYGALGTAWGLIAANNAGEDGDPVQKAPAGPMAAWGAAICGGTALVLDLLHTGRWRVHDGGVRDSSPPEEPTPTSLEVTPQLLRDGAGVALSIRF